MMKKLFALMLALCLVLCSAALAENEISWDQVEPLLTENGINGEFVTFEQIAVKVWIPEGMTAVEDMPENYIGYFGSPDQIGLVCGAYLVYYEELKDFALWNASEEEAFSRLKSLIAEETKFGDEVAIINSPLTRKNGELINASILRIGNQWMVYSDDNGSVYGYLVRRIENGNVVYEWNEDLNLEERSAVKLAIDVKQAKKPPQVVKLPVSISVVGGKK